jgi:hypothetical protein
VRDLLQGIKDPKANAAKETILANNHLRNDFAAAVTHLATSLQLQGSISDSNIRNVSGTQTARGQGGRQGHGRGHSQGNAQGRGRGRGRGRNIYLGSYSPKQWAALSPEDKQRVQDGCANSANTQNQGRGAPGAIKRNIAAVGTVDAQSQDDGISAITMGTATQVQDQNQRSDTTTAGQSMSRRQRINALQSSCRYQIISSADSSRRIAEVTRDRQTSTIFANCELDSHADASVAGLNFVVLEYTDLLCNVSPFAKSYEHKENVPIIKAATAYDDEKTGITYILILGQALYLGDDVETSLLCLYQMRSNGVIVDDVPVHLSHDHSSIHSIIYPDEEISIPLKLNGCFSYIPTRTPKNEEIETCKWLTLTSDTLWEPNSMPFNEYDEAVVNSINNGTVLDRSIFSMKRDMRDELAFNLNLDVLNSTSFARTRGLSSVNTNSKYPRTTVQDLAKKWARGEASATKILKVTTQKGVRNSLYPAEKRYRTKQAQLRYPQLSGRHGKFYTDTFFASVPALDMSKCCQLFMNDIGFTVIYPMRLKSEAPNALKCFLQDVGTPHALHSDNAKELMQGEWRKVFNDFSIRTTYTEPHSPWQNRAEGSIRETKRHIHRKMKSNKY